MSNGAGLTDGALAWSTMFGALIVPNPADANQYYIFSNNGHPTGDGTGLYHSIVDMTGDSGNGEVLATGKKTSLLTDTSELLQGAYHANGTDFWAVVIDDSNSTGAAMNLYAYRISAAGVSAPVITTLPGAVIDATYEANWFKISPDSQKAVVWVSSWTANTRKNLLLDFNNSTGVFTYNNTFGLLDTSSNSATDQDTRKGGFSEDSQYYYASRFITPYSGSFPVDLVQYPISGLNAATIPNTIATNVGTLDDIRIGPDNRAYVHLSNDNFALSRINSPNLAGVACDFQRGIIPLAGRSLSVTLSNTHLAPYNKYTLSVASLAITSNPDPITICPGEPVTFTANLTNSASPNYQWQIDGVDVGGEINSTFTTSALTNGQVVTCNTLDGCVTRASNNFTATVNTCTSTSIDFDGVNDYVNRSSILGGQGSISMMSWIKLDTGFSGGDIMGQGNYRLYVDGSDRLISQINEGGAYAGPVTYQLNMQDTANDGWTWAGVTGNLSVYANGVHVAGSPFTLLSDMSNASTETFTVNVGDVITMDFLSDNYPAEMSFNIVNTSETGTPQIFPVAGNHGHPGGGQATDNINPAFTASCGTCVGPATSHTTLLGNAPTLTEDLWYHVASVYDGATMKLYLNGELQDTRTGLAVALDANTDDFQVGRKADTGTNYFDGAIYETRIYDVALTETQLREQIHQEIQDNGGKVHGSIVPKDIDGGSLNWANLIAYYKLGTIVGGVTPDDSAGGTSATLNNMMTTQNRTAPIPYVANTSGAWTTVGTWQNGTEWDITSLPNKDWAIVQVTNNSKVTTTASHTHLGLIVATGSELEIQNDQLLNNTSYVKLDGQIDLVDESQFIQTVTSDLDVTSAGYLERDQQGRGDVFSYNYWSSPVSPINNTANNTDYSLSDILYDGTDANNPLPMNFIGGNNYDGSPASGGTAATLADYWVFKFVDQNYLYANWYLGWVRSTGTMKVGEGYTQKGTGAGASQNYVFVGKPNNGVIAHNITAGRTLVLGNPYPSALDANAFITQNVNLLQGGTLNGSAITGTLYFWEHWGGGTHIYADYQGGYASYNLTGGVAAISDPEVSSIGTGSVIPKRYIPVGQGFYIQGASTGTIEFNNSQRVFEKEGADSVFVKSSSDSPVEAEVDDITRYYFNFTTPDGPSRELLLGVKADLPAGINYGYDGKSLDEQPTDCSFKEGDTPLVIQAIPSIYADLELPLEIKIGNGGLCKFETSGAIELPVGLEMYFVDKELNTATKLEEGSAVEFNLENGVYNDRFYLVFKLAQVLDIEEEEIVATENNLTVYYNTATQNVVISNSKEFSASNINLYNVLGQQVYRSLKSYTNTTELRIPVNVSTGTYLVNFEYNNGVMITRKLMIK